MDMRQATTCVECIWGAGVGSRAMPVAVDGWALCPTGAWGRSSLGRSKCKMSLRRDGRTAEQRWEKAAMTATLQLSLMEREKPPHPPIRQRLLASTATTSYPPRDIYLPLYENKL